MISRKVVTVPELLEVLRTGDSSQLIGISEVAEIDFKQELYNLKPTDGKASKQFELGKDVAAIANSKQGTGIICFGISTVLVGGHDCATQVTGVDPQQIKEDSWRKRVQHSIHPSIPDEMLSFECFDFPEGSVVALIIDVLPTHLYPLMAKQVKDDVECFLVPIRTGARTVSELTTHRIHEYIQRGLEYQTLLPDLDQLDRIEQKLDLVIGERNSSLVLEREETLLLPEVFTSQGSFQLRAKPAKAFKFPNFFEPNGNEALEVLKSPPSLRRHGWDMTPPERWDHSSLFEQGRWITCSTTRKYISISERGELVAIGSLRGYFDHSVSHLAEKRGHDVIFVNNFALVEFVDRFFALLKALAVQCNMSPEFKVSVDFNVPSDHSVHLTRPFQMGFYSREVSNALTKSRSFTAENLDVADTEPKYLAGKLVSQIYIDVFNELDTVRPYLKEDNGGNWYVNEELYT